jgi:hypothetical protein
MRGALLVSLLVVLGTGSGLLAAPPTSNNCDKYLGVWEYVDPSPPGRAIISRHGDKYSIVWVATDRDRKLPAGAPTTEAQKAQAYSTGSAGAAELTCGPKRDRFRILYHMNPSEVGTEFEAEAQATADGLTWWYLRPDGTRGDMGAARRLK